MYDLYRSTPGYEPLVLAVSDDRSGIRGVLLAVRIRDLKGLAGKLSSRVLIYDGPVLDLQVEEPSEPMSMLLNGLILRCHRDSLFIQFRNLHDMSRFHDVFCRHGFSYSPHLNLVVPTSGEPSALSGISKSKLRQAQQSMQAGAELVMASTEEEVVDFYQILRDTYRTRARKPLAPVSFFTNFFHASQRGELGFILLVKYAGRVAGGMVCLLEPGRALTEWYVCGMDRQWKNVYPSVLATYGAIKYAVDHSVPFFDFLGLGHPDQPYGVRDFKLRFGGAIVNYGRYQRINKPLLYNLSRLGLRIWGWLSRIFS